MNIRELRLRTGLSQQKFADYFHIPLRTLQNWEYGEREAPEYLVKLIEYKLKMEGLMLSHLEIYSLSTSIKVIPARLIPALKKSEFVKDMEYVGSVKHGTATLKKYRLTVKEMVYTNKIRPEKEITVFAGDHIKITQDYNYFNFNPHPYG